MLTEDVETERIEIEHTEENRRNEEKKAQKTEKSFHQDTSVTARHVDSHILKHILHR